MHSIKEYCNSKEGKLKFWITLSHTEPVMAAYGFDVKKDLLTQLLELNLAIAKKEEKRESVQEPGLPRWINSREKFISDVCVNFER